MRGESIEPGQGEKQMSEITFAIVEKNDKTKREVMELLGQYPEHYVQGVFKPFAEKDFSDSDVMIAYDGDTPVGCLMLNRTTNEFNWLAVKRGIGSKAEIAKRLFESYYPTIAPGTKVHLFVPTEDATIADQPTFSGAIFEPARKLYRSMEFVMNQDNRVENYYGPGDHAYQIAWTVH